MAPGENEFDTPDLDSRHKDAYWNKKEILDMYFNEKLLHNLSFPANFAHPDNHSGKWSNLSS